jgi:uncharacterized protein YdaU (DUF1376 family)
MTHPPAFQLYTDDWLGSTKIALMSPAEEGAYVHLLCHCWNDPSCSIPNEDAKLAVLSRLGEQWFNGASITLRACFTPHPRHPERLCNARLLAEFTSLQKFRRDKQRAGKIGGMKSGVSRRQMKEKEPEIDTKHTSVSASSKTQAKRTSSSSSSSSILREEKKAVSTSLNTASSVQANGQKTRRKRLTDDDFLTELKQNAAYSGIDIERELGKLQAWLLSPKGRGKQLTHNRFLSWLNNADRPMLTRKERFPL